MAPDLNIVKYQMLDSETLRPVIIGMALFIILVHLLPKIVKEPTNVKFVDDVVMLSVTLNSFIMPGTILTGLIVFLTNYINAKVL